MNFIIFVVNIGFGIFQIYFTILAKCHLYGEISYYEQGVFADIIDAGFKIWIVRRMALIVRFLQIID